MLRTDLLTIEDQFALTNHKQHVIDHAADKAQHSFVLVEHDSIDDCEDSH